MYSCSLRAKARNASYTERWWQAYTDILQRQKTEMLKLIKTNYNLILTTFGFLIVGIIIAFLFEDYYRQFVRYLFKLFNGDNIQFIGKNFHLFASNQFVFAFGLYSALTYIFIIQVFQTNKFITLTITLLLFFTTTIFITALDSKRLIIECTACEGIRELTYNEVTYDKYFIASLVVSFIYLIILTIIMKRKQKLN